MITTLKEVTSKKLKRNTDVCFVAVKSKSAKPISVKPICMMVLLTILSLKECRYLIQEIG